MTGQDRTGQEGTGQEGTGQEGTGQDHLGQKEASPPGSLTLCHTHQQGNWLDLDRQEEYRSRGVGKSTGIQDYR